MKSLFSLLRALRSTIPVLGFLFALFPFTLLHATSLNQRVSEPIVSGVFFYSPTCPHCHEVLENYWPAIAAEYGSSMRIVFVDASDEEGAAIMDQTLAYMGIDASGVPMLVIGNEVMIGSADIPARAPGVIQQALAAGGAPLPPVPALIARFDAMLAADAEVATLMPPVDNSQSTASAANAPSQMETVAGEVESSTDEIFAAVNTDSESVAAISTNIPEISGTTVASTSMMLRFLRDPVGNSAALFVLLLLAISLLLFGLHLIFDRNNKRRWGDIAHWLRNKAIVLIGATGLILALNILLAARDEVLVLIIALLQATAFLALITAVIRNQQSHRYVRLMPTLAVGAGLLVAAYLTYVETTANAAICGLVGECNTVQQSSYAAIAGIPVGTLGMVGYTLLLAISIVAMQNPGGYGNLSKQLLEWLTVAAMAFSVWLTFLEPFVIGATCAWCLLSALWILVLFWLTMRWQVTRLAPGATPSKHHSSRRQAHA